MSSLLRGVGNKHCRDLNWGTNPGTEGSRLSRICLTHRCCWSLSQSVSSVICVPRQWWGRNFTSRVIYFFSAPSASIPASWSLFYCAGRGWRPALDWREMPASVFGNEMLCAGRAEWLHSACARKFEKKVLGVQEKKREREKQRERDTERKREGEKQRERDTERWSEKQRKRDTERKSEKQRKRDTEREWEAKGERER